MILMTPEAAAAWRAKRRRMGDWMFIRHMRNQGLSLEAAYFVLFGEQMRDFRSKSAA
ncbi:hypothetical protein [Herbaspirillum huttiense]|uniref:Uncharacterized protein n=1 Tax=Herbaspirillum huttiense subsp. lycopersici TaxID=3074428 RepID=A0ABU2EGQ6_9BURK|nr:hypothetical protein [Herbaspirillum huttiense]MDR9847047.1 hypothetical protein [Herbaspirillum huttiense SE1]